MQLLGSCASGAGPLAATPGTRSTGLHRRLMHAWERTQGMAGAQMGIWCAHGEGRATFPDPAVQAAVLRSGQAPIRCDPTPLRCACGRQGGLPWRCHVWLLVPRAGGAGLPLRCLPVLAESGRS